MNKTFVRTYFKFKDTNAYLKTRVTLKVCTIHGW